MKKLRILVDMDGILVDLLSEWLRVWNRENDQNYLVENIRRWDLHLDTGGDRAIYDILKRPGLFERLPAHEGAVEGVKNLLCAGHEVKLATSPPSVESLAGKAAWVEREFKGTSLKPKDIIFTKHKEWLAPSVDLLIDDKPSTIWKWAEGPSKIFTIRHPYNTHACRDANVVAGNWWDTRAAWAVLVYEVERLANQ